VVVVDTDDETTPRSSDDVPPTPPDMAMEEVENNDEEPDEEDDTVDVPVPTASKKRRKGDCNRKYHPEWRYEFLAEFRESDGKCTCIECGKSMTTKGSVVKKHFNEKHSEMKDWSLERRKLHAEKIIKDRKKQTPRL
jgi:hypothetical protein